MRRRPLFLRPRPLPSTPSATAHTLLEGMLLAALVVWLFLRDWRATLITAVAMPSCAGMGKSSW